MSAPAVHLLRTLTLLVALAGGVLVAPLLHAAAHMAEQAHAHAEAAVPGEASADAPPCALCDAAVGQGGAPLVCGTSMAVRWPVATWPVMPAAAPPVAAPAAGPDVRGPPTAG